MHILAKDLGFKRNVRTPGDWPIPPGDGSAIATLIRLHDELEASRRRMIRTAIAKDCAAVAVGIAACVLLSLIIVRIAPACGASGASASVSIGSTIKLGGC
jgi:hypothetical protein